MKTICAVLMVTTLICLVGVTIFLVWRKPDYSHKKVIIVGGGMAGTKLANTLHEEGVPFLLLEASDCIGGRMKKTTFGE